MVKTGLIIIGILILLAFALDSEREHQTVFEQCFTDTCCSEKHELQCIYEGATNNCLCISTTGRGLILNA